MIWSRIIAVLLVAGAVGWIASGQLGTKEEAAPQTASSEPAAPALFRVAIQEAVVEQRSRKLTLSGRTEADIRTTAVARTSGTLTAVKVRRGSVVAAGDVIAVLSDEARESNVQQAQARVEQRMKEYDAKRLLVESGNLARLSLAQFEADLKGAQAQLAQAEAERDRGVVLAPVAGIVNEVPVTLGESLQPGAPVAEVMSLDPMLAVVEISERRLSGVRIGEKADVRLMNGEEVSGTVRFISNRASPQTRTYRVDVSIPNPNNTIFDGVTAEVGLYLAPVASTRVARSALTFSADGRLGVRAVSTENKVLFVPVDLVEDQTEYLYVAGIPEGTRIIVQGQDFVTEGQPVEPVPAKIS
ncbi:MAG: efflux RND transporter periplasmic adaptor subunit [Hyphomicrobiales bacterium]